ncbi:electron transfer flavoprotein subunit alpha/FixB family protein [Peptoniphilus catoniae]|uniref:electron transfer flavoprotein subunit alpha/FixB family protein n=1 Tax=Peptoniphilus catoniae TaxID=1660341 RepID=UPI0010FE8D46|nr:electron transfer flavoprotein subunit alpha/FixB family protein [Peptoniphilus catoniae]
MEKDILVVCALEEGSLTNPSIEAIGKGRELANDLKENVLALICGKDLNKAAKEAIGYGADKVIKVEDPRLSNYTTLPYTKVLDKVIDEFKPFGVLIPATQNGRDLGGRISARRSIGLVADCIEVKVLKEERDLTWTRPTFDGQLFSDIRITSSPKIGTIGPSTFKMPEFDPDRKGEIIEYSSPVTNEDIMIEILGFIKKHNSDPEVSSASIIVAGGLGLKEPKNIKIIKDLAEVMGAAVSGSKPLADQLWIPQDSFVGMSGLKVSPRLYIAIGISGAAQHIQGMRDSGMIVAINNDPNAAIFKEAHYCIVGDLFEIVPQLTEKIKELKAQ